MCRSPLPRGTFKHWTIYWWFGVKFLGLLLGFVIQQIGKWQIAEWFFNWTSNSLFELDLTAMIDYQTSTQCRWLQAVACKWRYLTKKKKKSATRTNGAFKRVSMTAAAPMLTDGFSNFHVPIICPNIPFQLL